MDTQVLPNGSGRILNTTDFLGLKELLEIKEVSLEPIGIDKVVHIRELTESDRANVSAFRGEMRVNNKSNTTSFDAASLDRETNAKLVSAALWDTEAGKLVSEVLYEKQSSGRSRNNIHKEFLAFPARLVTFLAKEIREHNGMDTETVEERGKDD